jgi:hypothetical protein
MVVSIERASVICNKRLLSIFKRPIKKNNYSLKEINDLKQTSKSNNGLKNELLSNDNITSSTIIDSNINLAQSSDQHASKSDFKKKINVFLNRIHIDR